MTLLLGPATPRQGFAESVDDGDASAAARQAHARGIELYREGQYEEAVAEFRAAQQLAPAPSNLFNMARCAEQLGRVDEAVAILDEYLAIPGLPEDRRLRAERFRARLGALPGTVVVRSRPPGAAVLVNGHPPTPGAMTPATVQLEAGEHVVEVRLDGHESVRRPVTVVAAGTVEVEVTLVSTAAPAEGYDGQGEGPSTAAADEGERDAGAAAPGPSTGVGPGPWALLGVGAALAVAGIALDGVAFAESSRTAPFESQEEYTSWEGRVYDLALSGDVLLGAGVAAAMAGLIWYLAARAAPAATVGVLSLPGGGLALSGSGRF